MNGVGTRADIIQLVTVSCLNKQCEAEFRTSRVLNAPLDGNCTINYCVICGAPAKVKDDPKEDLWESLAMQYELPVEILKEVYAVWDSVKYSNFSEFVEWMKTEATQLSA